MIPSSSTWEPSSIGVDYQRMEEFMETTTGRYLDGHRRMRWLVDEVEAPPFMDDAEMIPQNLMGMLLNPSPSELPPSALAMVGTTARTWWQMWGTLGRVSKNHGCGSYQSQIMVLTTKNFWVTRLGRQEPWPWPDRGSCYEEFSLVQ